MNNQHLTAAQQDVLFQKGTEAPFSGKYDNHFETGVYHCANCSAELFVSQNKYDAGCGWPSFDRPATAASVVTAVDDSHGMERTEVVCKKCGGHLGHLFSDGPPETTGQRYCINSAALEFEQELQ